MYERENAFYGANREQIRQKYFGKEIVIAGDEIIGVYDDLDTAVDETEKTRPVEPSWESWEVFNQPSFSPEIRPFSNSDMSFTGFFRIPTCPLRHSNRDRFWYGLFP
jgi:hypothetical protein